MTRDERAALARQVAMEVELAHRQRQRQLRVVVDEAQAADERRRREREYVRSVVHPGRPDRG